MPTPEQIEFWKAQITKKHFGKVVKCFTCPQLDWGIYEVTGKKPGPKCSRFLSDGYPSSGTQLHCGPFGWNVEVAYNHPYGENSTKIHLVLVNNTVVKIQD